MDKKLFLEINEVSNEFLLSNNIKKFKFLNEILKSNSIFGKKIQTISEGKTEGLDLDPWIEWVTIHSGKKAVDHKISAIGTARNINFQMIWEKWEKEKITYSLCGVFNGFLRRSSFCNLFIPDPWSRESARPNIFNLLILGTSFLAKSYTGKNILIKFPIAIYSFLVYFPIIIFRFRVFIRIISEYLDINFSISDCYIIYEYLISIIGIYASKIFNSKRIILSTNLIAHAQHHFWKVGRKKKSCALALFLTNDLIKTTYECFNKTHKIYILNGLSQINVLDLNQYDYLPRKGHKYLLKKLEIKYQKIFEGMTHNAKLIFINKNQKKDALEKLINLKIDNKPIFLINSEENNSIEYYLNYRKEVSTSKKICNKEKTFNFHDLFYCVGIRSGSHNPNGFIIAPSKERNFNKINQILTHEIFSFFI